MVENRNTVGNNPYMYVLDDVGGIDIDTELDFNYAELL